MTDIEKRLVALDILITRTKAAKESQKSDLKRVKSYKGDSVEAVKLLEATRKTLSRVKKERDGIIAKLIKAEEAKRSAKS
jgi:hypothetical protein